MSNSITSTVLQQALFKYADKNKDHSLESGELKSITSALTGKEAPTNTDVANLLKQLDGDKNGKVSEGEFLQASIAAANSNSLSSDTLATLLNSNASTNPYAALTGSGNSTNITNLYSSLVSASLGAGSYSAAGAITGQLEYGALTAKGLLV